MKPTLFYTTAVACVASFALANPVANIDSANFGAEDVSNNMARDTAATLETGSTKFIPQLVSEACPSLSFLPESSSFVPSFCQIDS
ncbi:hypothetical protein FQN49_004042 [Arthroderma sp. PD_2]|nr:hypothetical protein FQN49_004042 [Arthroderma sp. PD_2]